MSVVQIYVKAGDQRLFRGNINEALIRTHSKRVRDVLNTNQLNALTKEVTLAGAAPAAFDFVIGKIKGVKPPQQLYIKVHDLPLVRAIAVYEATEAMIIEPVQSHIENHIIGWVTHNIVSPDEMVALHKVFYGRRDSSKVWDRLVHHIAWNIVEGKIVNPLGAELEVAARPYPELFEAVNEQKSVLEERKARQEELAARAREDAMRA